jgi:hypothetical protein
LALDPSIFLQGAALKAQRDAQLGGTIANVAQGVTAERARRQDAAAKGFEIEKLYETAVLKDQMGVPVSDLERAGFQAFQKVQQSKLSIDPLTGEPYSPYQPFSLGGQVAPRGPSAPAPAGFDMSIMPPAAPPSGPVVKGGPVPLDFSELGGAPVMAASDLGPYSAVTPSPGKPPMGLNVGALQPVAPDMQPRNKREAFEMRKMEMEEGSAARKDAQKLSLEREKTRPKAEAALMETVSKMGNVDSSINETIGMINNATAGLGAYGAKVKGTPAYNLNAALNTIKADAAFSELQKMRDMSPTGGALGAISEKELALLESAAAALDQGQSPEQLKQNLRKYQTIRQGALMRVADAFEAEYGYRPKISETSGSIKDKYGLE